MEIKREKNLQIIRIQKTNLISNHPVLDQVALNIAQGIDPMCLPDYPTHVFIGAHKLFTGAAKKRGKRVFIQTEHFFDSEGLPLWRRHKWLQLLYNMIVSDLFLDLSVYNKAAYDFLPKVMKKKIHFGPYIFPSHAISFSEGNGDVVFVGSVNQRRKNIITKLRDKGTQLLIGSNVFGSELETILNSCSCILNIHFSNGTYTEYPRLLSAYLKGKPVISERLDPLLVSNRHYIPIDSFRAEEQLEEIFYLFSKEFAQKYKFTEFIKNAR